MVGYFGRIVLQHGAGTILGGGAGGEQNYTGNKESHEMNLATPEAGNNQQGRIYNPSFLSNSAEITASRSGLRIRVRTPSLPNVSNIASVAASASA